MEQNTPPKNKGIHSFLSARGTLCKKDNILGHKTSLNKFKKTEIIQSIISDHNEMKLEIHNRRKIRNRMENLQIKEHTLK